MQESNFLQQENFGLLSQEQVVIKDSTNIPTLNYMNSNWNFMWNTHPRPNFNNILSEIPNKNWQYTLINLLETKSVISILKKYGLETTNIINKETNEMAKISLSTLEEKYNHSIKSLNTLSENDNEDKYFARNILFLNNSFDYEDNLKDGGLFIKKDNFTSAMLGTSALIKIEKEIDNTKDFETKLSNENKENLNYFGKIMIEHKQNPKSKDEFITDLKLHSQNNITKDEIEVLFKMYKLPRPPSLLNNEHKKLIKESLGIARAYEKFNGLDSTLLKDINNLLDSKEIKPKQKVKEKSQGLTL